MARMTWLNYKSNVLLILMDISLCLAQAGYKLPHITEPKCGAIYYPNVGDNGRLTCTAEGNPQPTYKWLHNRKLLSPSEGVSLDGGYLRIQNFSSINEGEFICVASNFFKEDQNTRTVAILSYPIQIILAHLNVTNERQVKIIPVEQNSYVNLACPLGEIKPEYRYSVVWYDKNNKNVADEKNDRHYVDSRGTLHFTYITRQDTLQENNVFNCTVTDPQLKTYHSPIQFALNLTKGQGATSKPPRLQYTVSNLTGLVNESVKLECVFSGRNLLEPKIPIVTWYKSDQRTGINNSTKYQLRQDNRSLTIVELTEGDEGYYYCKARINLDNSTSNDTDFAPIFLNVTSAPTFYIGGSPKDQTVGENQRAVFNCNAKGASSERDPDRPVWYINGETLDSIQAKSKFELSIDGKKLTINSVKRSDTLCVQCLVANSVGTTLGSGCLTVDIKAAGPNNVFDGTLIILTLLVTQSILW